MVHQPIEKSKVTLKLGHVTLFLAVEMGSKSISFPGIQDGTLTMLQPLTNLFLGLRGEENPMSLHSSPQAQGNCPSADQ
jgi:hypothetical protein